MSNFNFYKESQDKKNQETTSPKANSVNDIPKSEITVKNNTLVSVNRDATEIVVPEGVEDIGINAAQNCRLLTRVSLPSSLKHIGQSAFNGCSSLREINFPEGLEKIDRYAFFECTALESVSLPSSMRALEPAAFGSCHNLKELSLSEGITDIASSFAKNCFCLKRVTLPQSVEKISYSQLICSPSAPNTVLTFSDSGKQYVAAPDLSLPNSCYTSLDSVNLKETVLSNKEYSAVLTEALEYLCSIYSDDCKFERTSPITKNNLLAVKDGHFCGIICKFICDYWNYKDYDEFSTFVLLTPDSAPFPVKHLVHVNSPDDGDYSFKEESEQIFAWLVKK